MSESPAKSLIPDPDPDFICVLIVAYCKCKVAAISRLLDQIEFGRPLHICSTDNVVAALDSVQNQVRYGAAVCGAIFKPVTTDQAIEKQKLEASRYDLIIAGDLLPDGTMAAGQLISELERFRSKIPFIYFGQVHEGLPWCLRPSFPATFASERHPEELVLAVREVLNLTEPAQTQ